MDKVCYETYDTNEVYDSMDLNPKEKQVMFLFFVLFGIISINDNRQNKFEIICMKILPIDVTNLGPCYSTAEDGKEE